MATGARQFLLNLVLFLLMELQWAAGETTSSRLHRKLNATINNEGENLHDQAVELSTTLPEAAAAAGQQHTFTGEDYKELLNAQSLHHALSAFAYEPQKLPANAVNKGLSVDKGSIEKSTKQLGKIQVHPVDDDQRIPESKKSPAELLNESNKSLIAAAAEDLPKRSRGLSHRTAASNSGGLSRQLSPTTAQPATFDYEDKTSAAKEPAHRATTPAATRHRRLPLAQPESYRSVATASPAASSSAKGAADKWRNKRPQVPEESANHRERGSLAQSDRTFVPAGSSGQSETLPHRSSAIKAAARRTYVTLARPRQDAARAQEDEPPSRAGKSQRDQTVAQSAIPRTLPYADLAFDSPRVSPRQQQQQQQQQQQLLGVPDRRESHSTETHSPYGPSAARRANTRSHLNNPTGQVRAATPQPRYQELQEEQRVYQATPPRRKYAGPTATATTTPTVKSPSDGDSSLGRKSLEYEEEYDGPTAAARAGQRVSAPRPNYTSAKVEPTAKPRSKARFSSASRERVDYQIPSRPLSPGRNDYGDIDRYQEAEEARVRKRNLKEPESGSSSTTYKVTEDVSENAEDESPGQSGRSSTLPARRQADAVYANADIEDGDRESVEPRRTEANLDYYDQSVGQNVRRLAEVEYPDYPEEGLQDLAEEADHQHKQEKKPQSEDAEEGASGEEHKAQHDEGGEKSEKGYKELHEHDEAEKGHHDKESHDYEYDEKKGGEKKQSEEAGFEEERHKGDKGEKASGYSEKGEHSEGHNTKGNHVIHKKDEFEKKTEFFEEFHDSDEVEKDGAYLEDHHHEEGGRYRKGHKHEKFDEKEHGEKSKHEKGLDYHDKKGHKEHGADEQHHHREERHGKKGEHKDGKEWSHHKA